MLVIRRPKKDISDNYNAISIDRFSSKRKIWKDSLSYNNSFLCKLFFSSSSPSSQMDLISLLKIKNNYSLTSDWW